MLHFFNSCNCSSWEHLQFSILFSETILWMLFSPSVRTSSSKSQLVYNALGSLYLWNEGDLVSKGGNYYNWEEFRKSLHFIFIFGITFLSNYFEWKLINHNLYSFYYHQPLKNWHFHLETILGLVCNLSTQSFTPFIGSGSFIDGEVVANTHRLFKCLSQ